MPTKKGNTDVDITRLEGMISALDQKLEMSMNARDEKLNTLISKMDRYCDSTELRIRALENFKVEVNSKASQSNVSWNWIVTAIGFLLTGIKLFILK